MLVVGISTMALVIVLSVFNGLEGLLRNLYGTFDPQVTILPTEGKSFEYTDDLHEKVKSVEGVLSIADVIEDNALVMYKDAQRLVRLKGVGDGFTEQNRFASAIKNGDMKLKKGNVGYAIIGRGIKNELAIQLEDDFNALQIYYPKDIGPGQLNPDKMFTLRQILPGSSFAVEQYFDNNYIFVPIAFSVDLLNYGTKRTALELGIKNGSDPEKIRNELLSTLGPDFRILLGEEIHTSLYKILKWEKIFVFLALAAIIGIASINIYFSLSMLVLDKKKDLALLQAIGSPKSLLQKIFLVEGAIIAFSGAFTGLFIGVVISLLQQKFGFIGMGVEGSISNAYPVLVNWWDIVITVLFIILVTLICAIQPARKASKSVGLSLLQ